MEIVDIFNQTPFLQLLGIEVTEAEDGYAEAHLPMDDSLRSNEHGSVLHGGVTYALADTTGGAATISLVQDVAPTIDMRIDYIAPATTDLYASADVLRCGSSVAMVQIDVFDDEDQRVATAQGTYKTSGQGAETPWLNEDG